MAQGIWIWVWNVETIAQWSHGIAIKCTPDRAGGSNQALRLKLGTA